LDEHRHRFCFQLHLSEPLATLNRPRRPTMMTATTMTTPMLTPMPPPPPLPLPLHHHAGGDDAAASADAAAAEGGRAYASQRQNSGVADKSFEHSYLQSSQPQNEHVTLSLVVRSSIDEQQLRPPPESWLLLTTAALERRAGRSRRRRRPDPAAVMLDAFDTGEGAEAPAGALGCAR
jgi:hypothetical protein